jgi:pimeloyl-ACP methyl ester carboxylesterase
MRLMKGTSWRAGLAVAGGLLLSAACGALYQQVSTARDAHRFAAPGSLVDIGGRRLHLLCLGSGSPTVILESSGLGTVLQYQAVMQQLASAQRVCAYDRAGLGWSDASPLPATAQNLELDLDTLLHKAALEGPYIFVASSAGGLTIDLHMRKHPQGVAGVVWVDALSGEMVDTLPELKHLARAACAGYVSSWFGIPRLFDVLGILKQRSADAERSAALTYRTQSLSAACSMTRFFTQSAAEIRMAQKAASDVPVVVLVHGLPRGLDPGATRTALEQFEPKWLAAQHALAGRFQTSELRVVTDSGHLIALERPDTVVRAVRTLSATMKGGDL